ncbi:MAG: LOG family protein [Acidobacteriia bacterium]|nr:LOG family protein [Terriglobia bacterium]
MNSRKTVTVFGSRYPSDGHADYEAARRLGRLLAQNGLAVCTGGYSGVMEGVSRGAHEAGGHSIGVTVKSFSGKANPFITEEIRAATLFARLEQLMELGNAYVVFPGGMGTIAELCLAWNLVQMNQLANRRPIFLFGSPWPHMLDTWKKITDIFPQDYDLLKEVTKEEEIIAGLSDLILL